MANQNAQTPANPEAKTPKAEYEDLITTYKDQSPLAKQVGEAVISALMASTANPASVEVMREITEASQRGDEDKLFELMGKLKNIKDAEKTHQKKIAELRKNTDWAEIQQAFKAEFETLTYQAALTALKASHQALTASSRNTQSTGKPGRKPRDPNAEPTGPKLPRVALAGVFKVKTKEGSEYTLEAGKKGNFSWNGYSTLLDDLGIPYETENQNGKDKIVFKEDGIAVNKDDATLYTRTIAAIVQGVQNGLYEGATVSEVKPEPEKA
ncbi:hypothetical protein [Pseudomonas sp. FSL R10-2398]|uniref:hypothetical protein n=1 Tax=Pseudomonas sp. FSL R10-2398 TaxID=2662201 RepID=UPI001297B45F|nr:hypothetical protein [Pseudomonas sp. FSL R10-2398]MQT50897.1 hypothetical protein [Pseudomonas sp. FSL R10-2398]